MRNRSLYILTEDLIFFYMLKNALDKYKIEFQILNLDAKIPTLSSLILTTSEDFDKLEVRSRDNYLVYVKNCNFDKYLIRVIAAYRIGYKDIYSTLTFSIDPGNKFGLMIFLDDFYLNSYCCFEKPELLRTIKSHIQTFQEDNPNLMHINFKIGRGILPIAFNLVNDIYKIFNGRKNLMVYLIDEFRSSKIKLSGERKIRKISKDEISALILAFRNGISVNLDNYEYIFEQIKNKTLKKDNLESLKPDNHEEYLLELKEVVKKVLNGELSLSSAVVSLTNNKT